jgi:hypothetical protein
MQDAFFIFRPNSSTMRFLLLTVCFFSVHTLSAQFTTLFEQSGGRQTPTYAGIIDWWKDLDAASAQVKMQEMGPTDAGFPLHLVLVSADKDFDITSLKKKKKTIILVNNGIHPGEPDGIDASMLLVRDLIFPVKKDALSIVPPSGSLKTLPSNVVLAIIPVYNIGGTLNRSAFYRVDQNGPEEFGFRGNSQNLDLNRDFIKADSREALTFTKIYQMLDPDIFVDNHVSNGADYQHVMTLLTTQHNKLGGALGTFLNQVFEPALYRGMKEKGFDLVPYVNHFGETPESGWNEFWDSPRYSSGYAALWNSFAFVPETHMLKSYDQRVASTRYLMETFIEFATKNSSTITSLRAAERARQQTAPDLPLAWKWDRSMSTEILFKGYASGNKPSLVSGLPRLYYDRSKPYEKKVPFYNVYRDTLRVQRPQAYVIPQGWWKVIERLQANGIPMRKLSRDTVIEVEQYRIDNYQTSSRPFEGHHLNSGTQVSKSKSRVSFRKGDYWIPVSGKAVRFLMETLEPQGEDSYFAWNFFDPILNAKEGFSNYAFEETASVYLETKPDLKAKLEARRAADSTFAKSATAQLNFIYQNSPWYEPVHLRYPVYRVLP